MRVISHDADGDVDVGVYEHPRLGRLRTSSRGSLVLVRHFFRVTERDLAEARANAKRKAKSARQAETARAGSCVAGETAQKELAL